MTESAAGPSGPGTVVLELGADVGALVLYTPAGLDGREIEISREDGMRPADAFAGAAPPHGDRDQVRGRLPGPGRGTVHDLGRRAPAGRPRRHHRRPGHQLELAGLNPSRGWPQPALAAHGRPGRVLRVDRGLVFYTGRGRARIGVVVGCFEPGAGSTVRPSLSPLTIPVATTGEVTPPWASGSRPAETIFTGPISHSW